MEKTTRTLLSLLVISGLVFSACSSEPAEEPNILEPEVEEVIEVEEEPEELEEPEIVEETDEFIPPAPEEGEEPEEVEEVVEEEEDVVEEEEEATTDGPELTYANGTYTKTGMYNSPAGEEAMTFLFVVQDDFLYSTQAIVSSQNDTSQKFQQLFADGIASYTNGVKLSEVENVSALNGSSLTPDAFNQALAALKSSALN